MKHLFILVALVVSLSACARSLSVARLEHDPARYIDRTVSVSGVVTSSWGIPLVPFKLYKVDDGTGEVTVVSQNERIPPRGTRVRVKGRVADVAVLGGRSLGLHIKEDSLDVRGW